jgi:hypothetical protein
LPLAAAIAKFNADAIELQNTEFRRPRTPNEWQRMKNNPRPLDYSKLFDAVTPMLEAFESAGAAQRTAVGTKLNPDALGALSMFAESISVLAVRRDSPGLISRALAALAILSDVSDPRDLCFFLAPLYHSASKLGLDIPTIFAAAAPLVSCETFQEWMRHFPLRLPKDRALSAFRFREVCTDQGYDFVQDPYEPRLRIR